MKKSTRTYKLGEILSDSEAEVLLGKGVGGGWFIDTNGRKVYVCDGSHRDGTRGFKVLQFDGLS